MNLMIVCKFFINICHKHIHFKNSSGMIKDRKKLNIHKNVYCLKHYCNRLKNPCKRRAFCLEVANEL